MTSKFLKASGDLKSLFLGKIRKKNILISQKVYARTGFPNVVGAIDGTHIPIMGTNTIQIHTSVGRGFCFNNKNLSCVEKRRKIMNLFRVDDSKHAKYMYANEFLNVN